jgi:hypothetical protein
MIITLEREQSRGYALLEGTIVVLAYVTQNHRKLVQVIHLAKIQTAYCPSAEHPIVR